MAVCLSGCFGAKSQLALDKSYSSQIPATKLIIAKKQEELQLVHTSQVMPPIGLLWGPFGIVAQSLVETGIMLGATNLERQAFEPVRNDLLSMDFEGQLQTLLNADLQNNENFKFTPAEVQKAKDVNEMLQILKQQNYRFVAFVEPKYTIERRVSAIYMEAALSIYDKEGVWSNQNKMPKPIYKTTIYYTYRLSDPSIFSYSKNIARWQKDNSKLLKDEMYNGAQQLALNLVKNTSEPFVLIR